MFLFLSCASSPSKLIYQETIQTTHDGWTVPSLPTLKLAKLYKFAFMKCYKGWVLSLKWDRFSSICLGIRGSGSRTRKIERKMNMSEF